MNEKERILKEEVKASLLKYYGKKEGDIFLDEFIITKNTGNSWNRLTLVFKCPRGTVVAWRYPRNGKSL